MSVNGTVCLCSPFDSLNMSIDGTVETEESASTKVCKVISCLCLPFDTLNTSIDGTVQTEDSTGLTSVTEKNFGDLVIAFLRDKEQGILSYKNKLTTYIELAAVHHSNMMLKKVEQDCKLLVKVAQKEAADIIAKANCGQQTILEKAEYDGKLSIEGARKAAVFHSIKMSNKIERKKYILIEIAQKEAIDIMKKIDCKRQAAFIKSKGVLEKSECESKLLIEVAEKEATDIIKNAKFSEQALILQSKKILEQAECDSISLIQDARMKATDIIAEFNRSECELQARKILEKAEGDSKLLTDEAKAQCVETNIDKNNWEEEKKRVASTYHFENNEIRLDIGGQGFTTTLTTLRHFPESMIGAMFSGRHYLKRNNEGAFFIDRDGRYFHHILDFLRSPDNFVLNQEVMTNFNLRKELKNEAVFYGLGDRMFPGLISPAQPTNVRSEQGHIIEVTQDSDGIWFMAHLSYNVPSTVLTYCPQCNIGWIQYFHYGPQILKAFNTGRAILPCQPTCNMQKPCPRCHANSSRQATTSEK